MPKSYLNTPIGWLELTATQRVINGIQPVDRPGEECSNPILETAKQQLSEYFAGTRQVFTFAFRYRGATPFRIRVWDTLQKVPYGQTITYGALAAAIGCPGGARAVGGAVGHNSLLIAVPCHRVVAANSIGGFSCGLERKRSLLALERGCRTE